MLVATTFLTGRISLYWQDFQHVLASTTWTLTLRQATFLDFFRWFREKKQHVAVMPLGSTPNAISFSFSTKSKCISSNHVFLIVCSTTCAYCTSSAFLLLCHQRWTTTALTVGSCKSRHISPPAVLAYSTTNNYISQVSIRTLLVIMLSTDYSFSTLT